MCLAAGMLPRAISCWVASLPTAAGRATLHVVMQGNAAGAGWSRGADGTGTCPCQRVICARVSHSGAPRP
jgi:hypothetical protein